MQTTGSLTFHRANRHAESVSRIALGPVLQIAQDNDRALPWAELSKGYQQPIELGPTRSTVANPHIMVIAQLNLRTPSAQPPPSRRPPRQRRRGISQRIVHPRPRHI